MIDVILYQHMLFDLERELVQRQERIQQHGRDGLPADFAEQVSVRANDEVIDSLACRASEELQQVKAALARIEHGNYGVCTRCGVAIEPARLRAIPYAAACSGCA